jgi:hypothetical protein
MLAEHRGVSRRGKIPVTDEAGGITMGGIAGRGSGKIGVFGWRIWTWGELSTGVFVYYYV